MNRLGHYIKKINIQERKNRRRNNTMSLEIYNATVKGVKDIHTDDEPNKYWLSVDLDDGSERKLYVDQNCRHIAKGSRVTVHGYPIKKEGSNNQTCVKIETADGSAAPAPSKKEMNGMKAAITVGNSKDQWKEKYRLTMSNLLSAAIQSGRQVDMALYDEIDSIVVKVLNKEYDSEQAPF
jgi:hypothetical protein